MAILDEAVAAEPAIKVLTSSKATALRQEQPDAGSASRLPRLALDVATLGSDGAITEQVTLRPQLVVGCDGVHSMVRTTLAAWVEQRQAAIASSSTDGTDKAISMLRKALDSWQEKKQPASPSSTDSSDSSDKVMALVRKALAKLPDSGSSISSITDSITESTDKVIVIVRKALDSWQEKRQAAIASSSTDTTDTTDKAISMVRKVLASWQAKRQAASTSTSTSTDSTDHTDKAISMVLEALTNWQEQRLAAIASSIRAASPFGMSELPATSAGLRYRMLNMPASPATCQGTPLDHGSSLVLQGVTASATDLTLTMSMEPVKDAQQPRIATIATFPDHPIWRITDTDEMYGFLGSTFPQMDWRAAVPRQHMDTFVSHPGGTFPQPQACNKLSWAPRAKRSSPGSKEAAQQQGPAAVPSSGVLLLGDAIHCFPPDLAQGVNAALQDVEALGRALQDTGDDVAAAARAFEASRLQEAKALPQLVQVRCPLAGAFDAAAGLLGSIMLCTAPAVPWCALHASLCTTPTPPVKQPVIARAACPQQCSGLCSPAQ
jgi:2-polyprenyl-6-methoxyphenol hydroxylase-like FAD-dependent oxidoreductase